MELELVYNEETQEWEEKPEPFITIECETEEDFEFIGTAVAFYKKHLEEKPQTNADRIRAMSDEELAEFICGIFDDDEYFGKFINGRIIPCYDQHKIAEWLKQPAEEKVYQDCTYNKNGHCIGQKLMPECDAKNCDRKKP